MLLSHLHLKTQRESTVLLLPQNFPQGSMIFYHFCFLRVLKSTVNPPSLPSPNMTTTGLGPRKLWRRILEKEVWMKHIFACKVMLWSECLCSHKFTFWNLIPHVMVLGGLLLGGDLVSKAEPSRLRWFYLWKRPLYPIPMPVPLFLPP